MKLRSFGRSMLGKKLILSAALVGTAGSIAGLGSFATFTSSTSASQTNASGTVNIALGTAGSANNRLTIGASSLAAGDTIQRAVTLTNSGSLSLASTTLSTSASPSSLLDSDATNGLQMVIDKCSVPWTEAGTAPAYTYTCSGTTTTALASHAVVGSAMALSGLSSLSPAGVDYLRVMLTLPSSAPNTLQGLSSTITYAFNATQRTATNA